MLKLRMGILGNKYIHMPAFARQLKHTKDIPFKVICVADTNIDKGNRVANYFGARFYKDYEKLLEAEKLDCVLLQPIVSDHKPMAVAAMEKGIHVLCDKPLAESFEMELKIYEAYKKNTVKELEKKYHK